MPKIYKRILTPLFFAVVALFILCCSAFADDVSGIPTVSVNGGTPIPFISSTPESFVSGDKIVFVSSGNITFPFRIYSGVEVTVNPNVILNTNSNFNIRAGAILNNYGTIQRLGTSSIDGAVSVLGVFNMYYGSVVIDDYGSGVSIGSDGVFNLYNGTVTGEEYGVSFVTTSSGNGVFNFYNGVVTGGTEAISDINYVNVENGSIDIVDGQATISNNLLSIISSFVEESITWISSFISAITSNTILLVFVLVLFTGLGIGLLRRVKSI